MLGRLGRWSRKVPFTLVFACSGLTMIAGGILPIEEWREGGMFPRLLAGLFGVLILPAYLVTLVWALFLPADMKAYAFAVALLTCAAADAGLAALRRHADRTYGRRGQQPS